MELSERSRPAVPAALAPAARRRAPRRLALAVLLAVALPAAGRAQDPAAACAAAWKLRAEGHQGRWADPSRAAQAVAACERASQAAPESFAARADLLRALHFQGEFAARTPDEKKKVFGRGRDAAEVALDLLARKAGGRAKLDALSPQQAARALAGTPEAALLHLWAGVHWGLWGDAYGKLAAAREGVGDRIRRYCDLVNILDERVESAGGHRLLGRLHGIAPKIPLITGWVDRGKAVSELRRAVALAPGYPYNPLFLAEALLDHQPEKQAEAAEILRRLAALAPAPERLLEDSDARDQARARLAALR
jgi:hypothetical protein